MDKTSKLQYQQDVEKYLEEKRVYDIFEDLMKNLIINKPKDPLEYLIKKLQEPEQKRIFVVGPPGSKIRELAIDLSNHLEYTCISVGDLLRKEISKKSDIGQKIENSVKNFQYVDDKIVIDIVLKKLEELNSSTEEKRNYILEGFPKTRVQGLALQKIGTIPSSFLIYNIPDADIEKHALAKLDKHENYYDHLQDKQRYAAKYSQEYKLNLKQLKEIYERNYYQIDGTIAEPLEEMAKLVKFKIDQKAPRRPQKIIIIGPPGSEKAALSSALAQKYGFVNISSRELIMHQIQQHTEVGKIALKLFSQGDLIKDEIITGLIQDRIQRVDAHIQGFVLDGYPKNVVQISNLDDLKIQPSLIVILEANDEYITQRLKRKTTDPITGLVRSPLNPTNKRDLAEKIEKNDPSVAKLIEQKIGSWNKLLKDIEQNFCTQPHLMLKIQSDQQLQNILEQVSIHLEKAVLN